MRLRTWQRHRFLDPSERLTVKELAPAAAWRLLFHAQLESAASDYSYMKAEAHLL